MNTITVMLAQTIITIHQLLSLLPCPSQCGGGRGCSGCVGRVVGGRAVGLCVGHVVSGEHVGEFIPVFRTLIYSIAIMLWYGAYALISTYRNICKKKWLLI